MINLKHDSLIKPLKKSFNLNEKQTNKLKYENKKTERHWLVWYGVKHINCRKSAGCLTQAEPCNKKLTKAETDLETKTTEATTNP